MTARMRAETQAGVSLIEVLVAVLVLAVGVSGAMGMHLQAVRASHKAGLQSAALQVAVDAAERMRGHYLYSQRSGIAHFPFLGLDHDAEEAAVADAPARPCYRDPCGHEELAVFDLHEIRQRLQKAVPGGRIVVCRDSQPWDPARASLRWECDNDPDASVMVKIGWRTRDGQTAENAAADGRQRRALLALTVHP